MHYNLLFDLDMTLLDFHASERLALEAVMERNALRLTEEYYDFFKQSNKNLWLEFEKGIITKPELFETRFRLLFEKCGCDTGKTDLLRINDDFIDIMSQNGVVMDSALDFLQKLTDKMTDARIYIITNGVTRNAVGRINSTGLKDFIRDIFVSESMGASKPSRKFFDLVKKAIGEPDASFLVIGDSLTSDMLGAKNACLTSCWFMPQGDIEKAVREYEIDYTASSFDELFDTITEFINKQK